MDNAEFLEISKRVLENTRETCELLLELADHWGQDRAFVAFQADHAYPRELMVRMLNAAAHGATDTELFSIAAAVEKID